MVVVQWPGTVRAMQLYVHWCLVVGGWCLEKLGSGEASSWDSAWMQQSRHNWRRLVRRARRWSLASIFEAVWPLALSLVSDFVSFGFKKLPCRSYAMLEESTGNFSASRNVYDWYQTSTHVNLNIMIKNLTESDVKVRLIDETLDVSCNLADGNEFKLHFNLFKPIYVAESSWTVTPSKLEIKLKKTDRKRWQSLEVIPEKSGKRTSSVTGVIGPASKKIAASVDDTSVEAVPSSEYIDPMQNDMQDGKVKYDWFQTESHVKVSVLIRNLVEDETRIEFGENSASAILKLPDGSDYRLQLVLYRPIIPTESSYTITPSKLELNMAKAMNIRWQKLEADPNTEAEMAVNSLPINVEVIPEVMGEGVQVVTTEALESGAVTVSTASDGTIVLTTAAAVGASSESSDQPTTIAIHMAEELAQIAAADATVEPVASQNTIEGNEVNVTVADGQGNSSCNESNVTRVTTSLDQVVIEGASASTEPNTIVTDTSCNSIMESPNSVVVSQSSPQTDAQQQPQETLESQETLEPQQDTLEAQVPQEGTTINSVANLTTEDVQEVTSNGKPLSPAATSNEESTETGSAGNLKGGKKSDSKNWDKIVKEFEEEEAKNSNSKDVSDLFREIYEKSSDEVRKAMNKSFTESSGTVLSTNWNEVAKKKVTVKPPEGCDYKKWDQ